MGMTFSYYDNEYVHHTNEVFLVVFISYSFGKIIGRRNFVIHCVEMETGRDIILQH